MKIMIFSFVGLFFSFNAYADCSAFCVNGGNGANEIVLIKSKTADGLFRLCQGAHRKLLQKSTSDDEQILQLSPPFKVATAENSCGETDTDNSSHVSLDDSLDNLPDDSSTVESL